MSPPQPKRVAVIGGGCTGITSFWALQDSIHDVHLFEACASLGGRIKTLPYEHNGNRVDVNTEPPSFNAKASPNLVSLLGFFGISTSTTPFRFGVSGGTEAFQWEFSAVRSILLRPSMLCSLETYRLLFDILRLKYLGVDVLVDDPLSHKQPGATRFSTVQDYLSREGFSAGFKDRFLAPLLSMLWGTNAGRFVHRFPIKSLVRRLGDHHLLGVDASPRWQRIHVGMGKFIQIMSRDFYPEKVHLRTKAIEVGRLGKTKFVLLTSTGERMLFDHIIFAVDGQEVLKIANSIIDSDEREVLQGLRSSRNVAVLHSDPLLMPQESRSIFNYITFPNHETPHRPEFAPNTPPPPKACLTYTVNAQQAIPPRLFGRIFITINPFTPPHPNLVQAVWHYTDTEISPTTHHAQSRLSSIQNKRGMSYCVPHWTGRGFLEDAVTSGLVVAVEHLGAEVPFPVVDNRYYEWLDSMVSSSPTGRIGLRDEIIRTGLRLLRVWVLVLEIVWLLVEMLGSTALSSFGFWRRGYKAQALKAL